MHTTIRAFGTRFRYGSVLEGLNLAIYIDSRTHYAKGKRLPLAGLPQLVSAWFQVLFHSPSRGSFHLSLTVLVHYRSLASI